jgi:hypothetical protein
MNDVESALTKKLGQAKDQSRLETWRRFQSMNRPTVRLDFLCQFAPGRQGQKSQVNALSIGPASEF